MSTSVWICKKRLLIENYSIFDENDEATTIFSSHTFNVGDVVTADAPFGLLGTNGSQIIFYDFDIANVQCTDFQQFSKFSKHFRRFV